MSFLDNSNILIHWIVHKCFPPFCLNSSFFSFCGTKCLSLAWSSLTVFTWPCAGQFFLQPLSLNHGTHAHVQRNVQSKAQCVLKWKKKSVGCVGWFLDSPFWSMCLFFCERHAIIMITPKVVWRQVLDFSLFTLFQNHFGYLGLMQLHMNFRFDYFFILFLWRVSWIFWWELQCLCKSLWIVWSSWHYFFSLNME